MYVHATVCVALSQCNNNYERYMRGDDEGLEPEEPANVIQLVDESFKNSDVDRMTRNDSDEFWDVA